MNEESIPEQSGMTGGPSKTTELVDPSVLEQMRTAGLNVFERVNALDQGEGQFYFHMSFGKLSNADDLKAILENPSSSPTDTAGAAYSLLLHTGLELQEGLEAEETYGENIDRDIKAYFSDPAKRDNFLAITRGINGNMYQAADTARSLLGDESFANLTQQLLTPFGLELPGQEELQQARVVPNFSLQEARATFAYNQGTGMATDGATRVSQLIKKIAPPPPGATGPAPTGPVGK